jgi:hypothetical protein
VIFRRGLDDVIDQDAGHFDVAGTQRVGGDHALDLRDHQTAGILGRGGNGQSVQRQRFIFHGDIAIAIRGSAANERHIDAERFVQQPFLAVDDDDLDQLLPGRLVQPPAVLTGVDKGAEADFGEHATAFAGNFPVQLTHHTQRQVVGFHLAGQRQRAESGHQRPVTADDPLQQSAVGKTIDAAAVGGGAGGGGGRGGARGGGGGG